ncbi:hypothetical protein TNCV_468661 [Trichonephila clavipes]|nr:hypothetical protein TNCV_468661 [Trichonephila clavipes]
MLWTIAKYLSRDRPQVEARNTILTMDDFPPNDARAIANILGSHCQKMSRLTFNKADKYTERQAKLAVHNGSLLIYACPETKAAASNPGDPEDHMALSSAEIYFRDKELMCRTYVSIMYTPMALSKTD